MEKVQKIDLTDLIKEGTETVHIKFPNHSGRFNLKAEGFDGDDFSKGNTTMMFEWHYVDVSKQVERFRNPINEDLSEIGLKSIT